MSKFKTDPLPDEPSMSASSICDQDDGMQRVIAKLNAIGLSEINSEDVFERPKSEEKGIARQGTIKFYEPGMTEDSSSVH